MRFNSNGGIETVLCRLFNFLQRSYDEIVIDICSQNLPVTLCIDRAGVSGADGETHQGVFDLSFLSMIPNLSIAVPKDVNEFRSMLEFSATFDKPLAIRYPREGTHSFKLQSEIILGKWEMLSENENASASILACGERAVTAALEASQLLEKRKYQSQRYKFKVC